MNKLLVVLLAVCLVSAHAFVKRDTAAPAAASPASTIETIGKDLTALGDNIKNEMSKLLDPDKIKNELSTMIDNLNEAVKSFSKKEEAPKA